MTRLAPAALLLCASACSSEAPRNEAAAAPTPAVATPVAAAPVAPPAAMADAHARPQPGMLKTFGDWTVGCDNTKRCELRSLGAEDAPPTGDAALSIARDAGPDGRIAVTLADHDGGKLDAAVDGRVAGSPEQTLAAMVNGRVLAARAAGQTIATLSLKGASAALRYVDAVQGRAGTVTATVARGPRPASAVPAAAPVPTIVAVAASGAPAQPTAAQLAAMRRTAACEAPETPGGGGLDPQAIAVGGGRTLVLLPCSLGAYNLSSAVFVLDAGGFAPAQADAPLGFEETGADPGTRVPSVVNGEFRDGVLTSYAKGRGIGDCGVIQKLVWDGTRLRLAEQREMGECRGSTDYITTWRTAVTRR